MLGDIPGDKQGHQAGSGAKKVTVRCFIGRLWGEIILKLHFGVTSENRGAHVFFFFWFFFGDRDLRMLPMFSLPPNHSRPLYFRIPRR